MWCLLGNLKQLFNTILSLGLLLSPKCYQQLKVTKNKPCNKQAGLLNKTNLSLLHDDARPHSAKIIHHNHQILFPHANVFYKVFFLHSLLEKLFRALHVQITFICYIPLQQRNKQVAPNEWKLYIMMHTSIENKWTIFKELKKVEFHADIWYKWI